MQKRGHLNFNLYKYKLTEDRILSNFLVVEDNESINNNLYAEVGNLNATIIHVQKFKI